MCTRKAYFSQFHSVNSKTIQSCCSSKNNCDPRPQQVRAKEILIKYDEQHCSSHRSGDPGAIEGWTQIMKENVKSTVLKKQIRRHQKGRKGKHLNQYEPKYLQQTNTKGTISYLKQMLNYLRTSSQNTHNLPSKNKCSLPSVNFDEERQNASTILVKKGKHNRPRKEQHTLGEEEIIDQLINGINRLPVLAPSNQNISLQNRLRNRQKFTLDKLLD